jgi:hypothetical protein
MSALIEEKSVFEPEQVAQALQELYVAHWHEAVAHDGSLIFTLKASGERTKLMHGVLE